MMKRLAFLLALSFGMTPGLAAACDMVRSRVLSEAEERAEAAQSIRSAVAIIDGEVVRGFDGQNPALVRAVRTFKGPELALFEVRHGNSCEVLLAAPGMRMRMFLYGGPDLWRLPETLSNPVYEDELLGSDRTRDWPVRWGDGEAQQ